MRKGASISGRVFKPDGVTPVTQGNVVVFPRLRGKLTDNKIDGNGYYKVVGLGGPGVEELNYSVTVEALGYVDLAKSVKIKSSEEIKDFNFVVGIGKVYIKGTVTNSVDNQPIKEARISVLSVERPNSLDEISNGNAVTDEAGNYSVVGFAHLKNVDIAVFSDDYEMAKIIKYLKTGINIIDFTLIPKTKTLEPKERKEKAQLKCCDMEDLFKKIFSDISCKKPNSTDENGKQCINNTGISDCMKEKCAKGLIDIVCREDCPKDPDGTVPGGYTPKYNSSGSRGRVASAHSQMTTAEKKIVRDLLTFAQAPKLPIEMIDYSSGTYPVIHLEAKLCNNTETTATKAIIKVMTPGKDRVLFESTENISINPGGEAIIPISFTLPEISSSELGIFHTLYRLLDVYGLPLQWEPESLTARKMSKRCRKVG